MWKAGGDEVLGEGACLRLGERDGNDEGEGAGEVFDSLGTWWACGLGLW